MCARSLPHEKRARVHTHTAETLTQKEKRTQMVEVVAAVVVVTAIVVIVIIAVVITRSLRNITMC